MIRSNLGLVASLNRPGGNATGVNYFISELTAKRLGMLRELLPTATRVGALVNPTTTGAEAFTKDVIAAGSTLNIQIEIAHARDSHEIEVAFVTLGRTKIDALMVAPDTLFATSGRTQIVSLATQYAIPTIYTVREYVWDGGSATDRAWRTHIVRSQSTRVASSRAAPPPSWRRSRDSRHGTLCAPCHRAETLGSTGFVTGFVP